MRAPRGGPPGPSRSRSSRATRSARRRERSRLAGAEVGQPQGTVSFDVALALERHIAPSPGIPLAGDQEHHLRDGIGADAVFPPFKCRREGRGREGTGSVHERADAGVADVVAVVVELESDPEVLIPDDIADDGARVKGHERELADAPAEGLRGRGAFVDITDGGGIR